jgi:pimeloyl-ACP methyl ester carboxylesterase
LPAPGTECTTIDVPFDHDRPDGRTVALRVARQKSRAFPTHRAAFQLAGGPGGTSVGQSGTIPRLLPKLLDQFDLVYVDQRGTGGSGYLSCAGGYPETKDDWVACAGEHAKDDLTHDLTIDAAHDLESVRVALGYQKIHIRAGSYGTRLGLEFMRQHESSVAAIVLDGVDPPDNTFFEDFIRAVDRGVAHLAADCTKSAACATITTDVVADLTAHRDAIKTTPRPIVADGQPSTEDEATFLAVLGAAVFDATTYYLIPRAMHNARHGDFAAWDALIGKITGQTVTEPVNGRRMPPGDPLRRFSPHVHGTGTSYVAPGLYMAVICAEDLPNTPSVAALRTLNAAQVWGGDPNMVDIADACSAWKMTPLAASQRAPVHSDAKVLLLNGELDLNTFPEWGAHAAETLTHATSIVVPYATHSTMGIPCVGQVITDFLAHDGDMGAVDASCIRALPAPATW